MVVCEWEEEPKDAEEARKREAIRNYMEYITTTPEFKKMLGDEFVKAFEDGRI